MLSSHATRKHLHTELGRFRSKPLSLKREFASSHREVLRRRTKSLRRTGRSFAGARTRFGARPALLAAERAAFAALGGLSLRGEWTSGRSEWPREEWVPVRDPYTPVWNRREALTRHPQLARGAAKRFRAPRAASQGSSSASVTFRGSSQRREQASGPPTFLRSRPCSDAGSRARTRGAVLGRGEPCSDAGSRARFRGVGGRIPSIRAPATCAELLRWNTDLGRKQREAARSAPCSLVLKEWSRVAARNRRRWEGNRLRASPRRPPRSPKPIRGP